MIFRYMAVPTKLPVPSLGGQQVRHRPVIPVLLAGTATPQLRDALLDTGSDDTVFADAVAMALGIDLSSAEQRSISLAGRPQPVPCRYAIVELRITDGTEIAHNYRHFDLRLPPNDIVLVPTSTVA